jgi:hypothetical protein
MKISEYPGQNQFQTVVPIPADLQVTNVDDWEIRRTEWSAPKANAVADGNIAIGRRKS